MSRLLRIDPIACDGRGICAELFPERIRLDDWGYPMLDPRPIPASLATHARRAVAGCPTLALRLEEAAVEPRNFEPKTGASRPQTPRSVRAS